MRTAQNQISGWNRQDEIDEIGKMRDENEQKGEMEIGGTDEGPKTEGSCPPSTPNQFMTRYSNTSLGCSSEPAAGNICCLPSEAELCFKSSFMAANLGHAPGLRSVFWRSKIFHPDS